MTKNLNLSDEDIKRTTYIDTDFEPTPIIPNQLSKEDQKILGNLERKNKIAYNDYYVSEFLRCRSNPLYFIHNYCNISEVGAPRLYTKDMMNKKYRRLIKCLYRYHKCLLMASRQLGKALDLNTIIPTPNGFKRLEDLTVGDYVYSELGKPTQIIGESKVFYNKTCYKLYFDNGEFIIASVDHLWKLYDNPKIYKTSELLELFNQSKALRIKLPEPIETFNNQTVDERIASINYIFKDNGEVDTENNCYKIHVRTKYFLNTVHLLLSSLGVKNIPYYNYIVFYTNSPKFNFLSDNINFDEVIFNSVQIESIEEIKPVPCKCIVIDSPTKLFLASESMIPTHNSTIAACLLSHAITFFPGIRACIFNMDMGAGCENIAKVKFILENLPDWMRFTPKKITSKTFIDLTNDSKISVFYPSTIKSPEQLSRSLTIPVLYVDEAAFIRYIDKIWTAAQPTRSTACEQAARYNYPYWALMTSTPNGSQGTGQFFFDYWNLAIDSDDIFEIDKSQTSDGETNQNFVYEKFKNNADLLVSDPNKNSFIKIKYKWDEDPRKSQEWYQEQCRELNFKKRNIAQELDLEFVGSTNCPFDDDVLAKLQQSVIKPIDFLQLSNGGVLKIFDSIDPLDYYLIGVDTASAINGCYSAIEVYSFRDFKQVAELALRVGSLHQYGEMVYDTTKHFVNQSGGRVILVIENNSIGKSIVEQIQLTDMGYYLYHERQKLDSRGVITEYGLNTNSRTKSIMVAELYKFINETPENFKSEELVNQLHAIERNNAGQITSSAYSDMFMASCFCAYARKDKELEILPLISFGSNYQENETKIVKSIIQMSNPKDYANERERREIYLNNFEDEVEENIIHPDQEQHDPLPFFFNI